MMNKDEIQGGIRNIVGRGESAVGGATGSTEWKANGLIDQVAGGVQHLYGRARGQVADAIDAAPDMIGEAGDRVRAAAVRGRDVTVDAVEDNPVLWAAAAALGAYALAWYIHGRR